MTTRVALIPAILTMVLLAGCEPPAQPAPVAKVEPAPTNQELTPAEIGQYLPDTAIYLEPSSSRVLSGDLRPLWVVSGRVISSYPRDLKSAKIRLTAFRKGARTVLDTADFEVDDIPAMSAKGFRREVQMMIRPGEFDFSYDFLSVTVKPE